MFQLAKKVLIAAMLIYVLQFGILIGESHLASELTEGTGGVSVPAFVGENLGELTEMARKALTRTEAVCIAAVQTVQGWFAEADTAE